ncbi:MAG: serine hydrolase domain-containing protein [Flavobacteriales bacterium]
MKPATEIHNEDTIHRIDGNTILSSDLTTRIQSLMDSAMVTGLAITIFNGNNVVYKQAFGKANIKTGELLQTDHVFYGASLSKAVFGYLVASLVEENIIDLDKPLQEYLNVPIPELKFEEDWKSFHDIAQDHRYKLLTARMCLSHTTGFPNWRWIKKTGEIDENGKLQFLFEPGSEYSYSGEGIQLLQYVIEHITNKGLEQLARERVFDPLKMNMTSYVWQNKFENSFCYGHTVEQSLVDKDKEEEAGSAGSMETTLDDYTKFLSNVLLLEENKSQIPKLLFTPNIRIHSKTQFGISSLEHSQDNDAIQLSYGLGWGLLQSPFGYAAFKEGHAEGFQHYSIIFPERNCGILILSNSENAESIFCNLLKMSIGDQYTPCNWENYIPFQIH